MSPEIFISCTGSSETVNADHVEHWAIENGHAYLVCDGINHSDHTAKQVRQFCQSLKKANWCHSDTPVSQLTGNILATVDTLSSETVSTAFCLSISLVYQDYMVIGHCGDCRVGHLTENGIEWLTTDDVPYLGMYQNGLMTKERYQSLRHLLSCRLKTGRDNRNIIKTCTLSKPAPGHLLLCSDGFWAETEDLLTGNPEQSLDAIKRAIPELNIKARDNYSIIVV